jgi:hypothetical protein
MSRPTRLARRRPFLRPLSPNELYDPRTESEDTLHFSPEGIRHQAHVEVVLAGPIDPTTGMIIDVRDVDRILARALAPFERGDPRPASTEAWAADLFDILNADFAPVRLEKLRVIERADTWVDVWR